MTSCFNAVSLTHESCGDAEVPVAASQVPSDCVSVWRRGINNGIASRAYGVKGVVVSCVAGVLHIHQQHPGPAGVGAAGVPQELLARRDELGRPQAGPQRGGRGVGGGGVARDAHKAVVVHDLELPGRGWEEWGSGWGQAHSRTEIAARGLGVQVRVPVLRQNLRQAGGHHT
jgi:hypothetical protein